MDKLTPEQLVALREQSKNGVYGEYKIAYASDIPALLDHIKELEEEAKRREQVIDGSFKEVVYLRGSRTILSQAIKRVLEYDAQLPRIAIEILEKSLIESRLKGSDNRG